MQEDGQNNVQAWKSFAFGSSYVLLHHKTESRALSYSYKQLPPWLPLCFLTYDVILHLWRTCFCLMPPASIFAYSNPILQAAQDTFSTMKVLNNKVLCSGLAIWSTTTATSSRRCAYGDSCWPSEPTWQSFSDSISGSLIRTEPSASSCHDPHFDAKLCGIVKDNWANSTWRTSRPGSYAVMAWELGDGQCFVDSPREAQCDQGLGTLLYNITGKRQC